MLRVAVCVSGGGTNLQAIIDAVRNGTVKDTKIVRVISNNPGARALKRAADAGIEGICVSPKRFESRELFNEALLAALNEAQPDLIVLAGFMVAVPGCVINAYRGRIINIHPALIPSFCGKGYYGLHVHEKSSREAPRLRARQFILSTRISTTARSFFRKRWMCARETRRKYCRGVLWSRRSGSCCLWPSP